MHDVAAPVAVHVLDPEPAVTVYEVIGLPPFDAGGVQATSTAELPRVACTPVGAPGVVAGITPALGADGRPVPAEFVAATVNV